MLPSGKLQGRSNGAPLFGGLGGPGRRPSAGAAGFGKDGETIRPVGQESDNILRSDPRPGFYSVSLIVDRVAQRGPGIAISLLVISIVAWLRQETVSKRGIVTGRSSQPGLEGI